MKQNINRMFYIEPYQYCNIEKKCIRTKGHCYISERSIDVIAFSDDITHIYADIYIRREDHPIRVTKERALEIMVMMEE